MATIRKDAALALDAESAWRALREFGDADRLFAGVLSGCACDGDVRTVTFVNGLVVRERLVTRDDAARRIVYAVLDGSFTQHSASMEIAPDGQGSRFIWTSDFLPDEAAEGVLPLVEAGCAALQRNLAAQRA
jgi:hypothetical protein